MREEWLQELLTTLMPDEVLLSLVRKSSPSPRRAVPAAIQPRTSSTSEASSCPLPLGIGSPHVSTSEPGISAASLV